MNKLILLLTLLISFQAMSHCGACGEGTAADHVEKGEDHSHHEHDEQMAVEEQEEDDDEEEKED